MHFGAKVRRLIYDVDAVKSARRLYFNKPRFRWNFYMRNNYADVIVFITPPPLWGFPSHELRLATHQTDPPVRLPFAFLPPRSGQPPRRNERGVAARPLRPLHAYSQQQRPLDDVAAVAVGVAQRTSRPTSTAVRRHRHCGLHRRGRRLATRRWRSWPRGDAAAVARKQW